MKWKKITARLLVMIFVLSTVGGCGKTAPVKEKKKVAMGRYVEKTVDMPEAVKTGQEIAYEVVKNPKGEIEFYAFLGKAKDNEKFIKYTMNKEHQWKRTVLKWPNQKKEDNLELCYAPDGTTYGLVSSYEGTAEKVSIIKSTDGEHFEPVDFKPFEKKIDYKECPGTFRVTEDNSMIFGYTYTGGLKIYKDGKLRREIKTSDSTFTLNDNKLFTFNEKANALLQIDLSNGKTISEIPLGGEGQGGSFTTDKEGNLYLISSKGIQRLVKGGSCMETILDGSLTSLSSVSMFPTSVIKEDNDQFYVLFMGGESEALKYYVYDKNIPTTPNKTLSIVSLNEDPTVKDAIVEFQLKNQDAKVDYKVLMNGENGTTKSDYIKTINTEILAGKGADIILLDDMPVESYIEKGVLADMSNVIEPLVKKGEILSNIIEPYKKNGKIYEAPIRYGISYAFGIKDAIKTVKSIQTMGNYAKTAKIPLFGEKSVSYKELTTMLYQFYSGEFIEKDRKIDRAGLITFLNNLEIICKQTKASQEEIKRSEYEEPEDNWSRSDLIYHKKALLGLSNLNDMVHMYSPCFVIDKINGSYSTVNGQFIAEGSVGINNASKNKKLAEEFMKALYSYKAQKQEWARGFPLNIKALEKYGLAYVDDCFGIDNFVITQPSEEKIKKIHEMCKKVTTPINMDETLLNMIQAETEPYLKGNADITATADKIIEKTKTYLGE